MLRMLWIIWTHIVWPNIKRYVIAEIPGTICMLAVGWIVHSWLHDSVVTAIASGWGENVGFYGYIIISDLVKQVNVQKFNLGTIMLEGNNVLKDAMIEFGPAEMIDSFIRPGAIFISMLFTDNVIIAILVGKTAADILFYAIAALSKKYLAENKGLTSTQ